MASPPCSPTPGLRTISWSFVNLFHRKIARVAQQLDANEQAQRRSHLEGDEEDQWLVAQVDVPISDAMRKDAGPLHGRNEIQEVPLIWAVPVDSAEDIAGAFWAFFPTDTLNRMAGFINAPWKIDFGRSALVPGEYNTALTRAEADLIADTIPRLSSPEDPARTLDALPRTVERNEPATPLVDELWARLVPSAVVPDGTADSGQCLHQLAEKSFSLILIVDHFGGLVILVCPNHKSCQLAELPPSAVGNPPCGWLQKSGLPACGIGTTS
jgi:hypothetical protein